MEFGWNLIAMRSLALKGRAQMAEEPAEPTNVEEFTIPRLMKEGNVTQTQARQLIVALGHDWSSLFLEARFLAKKR